MAPPKIRIFFSSPGDVKMERETARRIVDRLQGEVGDRMAIEPYFWEHEVMVATKDYQENIPEMDGFDIVVCMLWSRLGTPLHPNRHPRPDGGYFESGTEYEFFTAMQAHNQRGTPDIFVFRNGTEPRRPSRPREAREAVDREVDRLDHFFERYFQEAQYFTGAVNVYSTLGEFEDKLTLALRSFIEGRFPQIARNAARRAARYGGVPYLGLSAFDFKDAPVFFGRTAQVGEVVEAFQTQELEAQANNGSGRRFVMIIGSSGSGKSSLARAGVLPMLVQPGVVENTHAWRRVVFKPGEAGADPFLAFATALLQPEGLPELAAAGTSPAVLGNLLRAEGGGFNILLRQAMAQAETVVKAADENRLREQIREFESGGREEDARLLREKISLLQPSIRLAVLADQLEELFTTGMPEETVALFIDRLAALAADGRIFVLGTLRSDFYPHCLQHPQLVELMRDNGTYALPAPGPADLGQMIRQPAAAAGLIFEENTATGEKLDELLRDAAIKDPSALPLLSYTLEQLYERRTPEGVMTLSAYRDLGGLEGAIGSRAESVFTSLPRDARDAFSEVWKQLVTLSENSEPVRRRTDYGALTASSGAPVLVDALTAARLLTIDRTTDGGRAVSVAHEALLKHWPRVVEWTRDNLDFLRARSRMAARLAEWLEHGSSEDYLIPAGPPLAEAEGILARHEASLDAREIDYVKRSSTRARRREQSRLRRARTVAAGALVLSALAVAGGVFSWIQSKAADRERVAAVAQKQVAQEAERMAVMNQARAAYLLGIENLENARSRDGLTNLAQALTLDPGNAAARDRLYSYHLYGLPKAIPIRSVAGPKASRQRITGATLGPTQRIVYLTDTKAAEVYDLNTRQVIPGPWEQEPDSFASVISYDGRFILNVRRDFSCRIWNTDSKEMSVPIRVPDTFTQVSITLDGEFLAYTLGDGTGCLFRCADGKQAATWKQEGAVDSFGETPEGNFVFTSGEEILAYDRYEMKVVARRKDPEYLLTRVEIAREADVVVVHRVPRPDKDNPAKFMGHGNLQFLDANTLLPIEDARIIPLESQVWNFQLNRQGTAVGLATGAHTAEIRHAFQAEEDRIFSFDTYPVRICFSPDERLFITSTPDGTVTIFDTETMKRAFEPISHDGRLEDMSISWDGRYLLTSTAERARIWDLTVGPALSLPMVQKDGISAITTDATGERMWIATSSRLQEWSLRDLKPAGPPMHVDAQNYDCLLDQTGTQAAYWNGKSVRFVRTDQPDTAKAVSWTPPGTLEYWTLTPDGSRFAAMVGNVIQFVDVAAGKVIGQPWKLEVAPSDLIFAQRGTFYAVIVPAAGNNFRARNEVKLWSVEGSREIPIQQAEASVTTLRSSPDGRWLMASAIGVGTAYQNFVVLWDLSAPEKAPRSIPHPDSISAVRFSADGRLFALGGTDQTVQVWNTEDATQAGAPIFEKSGRITELAFSPDSRTLATIATEEDHSCVRVWDWKEAVPISERFRLPTQALTLSYTPDGRKVIFSRPPSKGSGERLVQMVEVAPPPDLGIDLVALTEGVTARRVAAKGLPVITDPFGSWDRLRKAAGDSWFFQHPASRSVSPAIPAPSLRWIEEDAVAIDDLITAMPAVGLVRAAIGHWDQVRYSNREAALAKMDPQGDEYRMEQDQLAKLSRRIGRLIEFAERNATNDSAVCYHLALHATVEGDYGRARTFIDQALAISPDDPKILVQAAIICREQTDYPAEQKALRRLVELQPEVPGHRFSLGLNLWRTGVRKEAADLFSSVADNAEIAGRDRALMLFLLQRTKECSDLYLTLAEETRTGDDKAYNLDGLVFLIVAHQVAGRTDEAVEAFTKLIAAAPGAADPAIIDASTVRPELKEVLKKALVPTLERHPGLAPKESAQ